MRRNFIEIETSGSITIYLSLVLFMILALLFTIIEGAKFHTAKVYGERSLTVAMDSVLAGFYGPLWEEYHLFGLDTSFGSESMQEDEILAEIQDYMSYTFTPNRDINPSYYNEGVDLYDISVNSLSITDRAMLMDYSGELVVSQAVEYMKYKEVGNIIELLLDKMSLLERPGNISALYEEKQEVEEKLVGIDEGILELMEVLDGINTSKTGIEVNQEGSLKTVPYYVKKLCFSTIDSETVGINNDIIFKAIKDNYVNPIIYFDTIRESLQLIDNTNLEIGEMRVEYNEILSKVSMVNEILSELSNITNKTEEELTLINETKTHKENLVTEKNNLEIQLQQKRDQIQHYSSNMSTSQTEISRLIKQIIPKIDAAIIAIDHIKERVDYAEPILKAYEASLLLEKENVGHDIFLCLEDELEELKRYSNMKGVGYDFNGMRQTLEFDRSVLKSVESLLKQGENQLSQRMYDKASTSFQNAKEILITYRIENLKLDYSTLVLNKSKTQNPIDFIKTLAQEGVTGLVIDIDCISTNELSDNSLPSVIQKMSEEGGGVSFDIPLFFKEMNSSGKNSGVGNLFGSFGEDSKSMSTIEQGINEVAECFLFQEYIQEHFDRLPLEGENLETRKPSALSYEQEYLLIGNTVDKENLTSIISRIIGIRTVLNFVSLLGDREKCNEAKLAAAALVGFTGLPILINITQTLILLAWSFAEALIDARALTIGKEVPVFKKNLILNFSDLFLLNRTIIQKKASEMDNSGEIALSYQEYLSIFLLIKNQKDLVYRSMDLIQENIKIRYLDRFSFQHCFYGFRIKAEFLIKAKFTTALFVKKYLSGNAKGFYFETEVAYSY